MKQRKNQELDQFLFDKKEFKILISLQNRLSKYIDALNYLYNSKNVKYTLMVIKASEKSIKETLSNIRKTDIFLKIPYSKNHYILILQNTECKSAIQFGSRLTSLISRTFMLNKKHIDHKVALIAFETTPPSIMEICYETVHIMKKFNEENKDTDYWIEIKRF